MMNLTLLRHFFDHTKRSNLEKIYKIKDNSYLCYEYRNEDSIFGDSVAYIEDPSNKDIGYHIFLTIPTENKFFSIDTNFIDTDNSIRWFNLSEIKNDLDLYDDFEMILKYGKRITDEYFLEILNKLSGTNIHLETLFKDQIQ